MKHELPALKQMVENRLLEEGGLYLLEDIIEAVRVGEMQSFAVNDSWVVTCIVNYPRKTVLSIVMAAGDQTEIEGVLYPQMFDFARHVGADWIASLSARDGWAPIAKRQGWKRTGSTFLKDVNDGW